MERWVPSSTSFATHKSGRDDVRFVQEVFDAVEEAESLDAALTETLRLVCHFGDWMVGQAWLARADEAMIERRRSWSSDPSFGRLFEEGTRRRPTLGSGLAGRVFVTGSPLWIKDLQHDLRTLPAPIAQVRGAMSVPVKAQRQVVAVLEFFASEPREEDPGLMQVVLVATESLGHLIERRRIERALRDSGARYRLLIDLSPDAVFVHSGGRFILINQAGARLLGAETPDEIVGRYVMDVVHPDYRVIVSDRMQKTADTGEPSPLLEQRFVRLDGSYVDVEVAAVRFTFGGETAVQVIARDITGRKQVEAERARILALEQAARAQSEVLSRRLVEAQETERRYLARELHDEVGQILTGLKLMLESGPEPPEPWSSRHAEMQGIVNDLMVRVREMSLDLRPGMLDDLGLLPALLWLFGRYTSQTQVRVNFEHEGIEGRLPTDVETAAYRIVQEALTNAARHSGTDQVNVSIKGSEGGLILSVTDFGKGFDADGVKRRPVAGLAGMKERAAILGGGLSVESKPGEGTRIVARIPLEKQGVGMAS